MIFVSLHMYIQIPFLNFQNQSPHPQNRYRVTGNTPFFSKFSISCLTLSVNRGNMDSIGEDMAKRNFLITKKAIASYLGISRHTIRRWLNRSGVDIKDVHSVLNWIVALKSKGGK